MPAEIVLDFVLATAGLLGTIVLFAAVAQLIAARRREAAIRGPVVASIGSAVGLDAAIALVTVAATHLTTQSFVAVH